jgi:hypothetical protein
MHHPVALRPCVTLVPAVLERHLFQQTTNCNGSKVELGVSGRLGVLKNAPSCFRAQVV